MLSDIRWQHSPEKTLKQAEKNGDADDTGDTLSLAIVQLTHQPSTTTTTTTAGNKMLDSICHTKFVFYIFVFCGKITLDNRAANGVRLKGIRCQGRGVPREDDLEVGN